MFQGWEFLFLPLLLAVLLFAYMVFIETRRYRISYEALETNPGRSFKVLHLSDFHFRKGDEIKCSFIQSLKKEKADLVFVTGDIIDNNSGIDYCVQALGELKPEFGLYVVLGAHDYYELGLKDLFNGLVLKKKVKNLENDIETLCKKMEEEAGAIVLRNAGVDVEYEDDEGNNRIMQIAGIDDVFIGKDDIKKATSSFEEKTFKILLTHCIDNPKELASHQFNAVFGGHSHGGQVRFPWLGALTTNSNLARKYARGIFKIGQTQFHINNGIGAGKWTDFRFLCPPEATILEMRAKKSNESQITH